MAYYMLYKLYKYLATPADHLPRKSTRCIIIIIIIIIGLVIKFIQRTVCHKKSQALRVRTVNAGIG